MDLFFSINNEKTRAFLYEYHANDTTPFLIWCSDVFVNQILRRYLSSSMRTRQTCFLLSSPLKAYADDNPP